MSSDSFDLGYFCFSGEPYRDVDGMWTHSWTCNASHIWGLVLTNRP